MVRHLRKLVLLLPLCLNGCMLFGITMGLLNILLPVAVSVGGVALGVWLTRR